MTDVLIIGLMLVLFFVTAWMVPGLTRLMGR
jgi:hypothetical protein